MGGPKLAAESEGIFAATLEAEAGSDYGFSLDGGPPNADPCSRWQPGGLRGPSRILDPNEFAWTAEPVPISLERLVVYELHVGTFTPAGTFDAAIARLAELASLGVTAIELMPVATFSGERGWGYDGVFVYAPHRAYGGPAGLARLVDAAHGHGLAVILDVVYNHIGPGSELVRRFGPYFTDRHETFWGEAIDYSRTGVREWAIQNAEQWVRDYRIDGLRLDATHAIFDDIEPARAARARRPGARSPIPARSSSPRWRSGTAAHSRNGVTTPSGHDDFHHALHALLTGERDGYYAPYGSVADLARAYHEEPAERLVICASNHDQIGNRAFGDRLPPATRRLAAACLLFAPQIPLLFQGEEYGETAPFLYFTDHDDPEIARAVREGRRREFAGFDSFGGEELPDPQALETFDRLESIPKAATPSYATSTARLLRLRAGLPPRAHDRGRTREHERFGCGAAPSSSSRTSPDSASSSVRADLRRSPEPEQRALVLEQEALDVEPTAEPGERAVCADHSVARQDDRERVLTVGGSDRPGGLRREPEPPGLLAVAHGLAVRDRGESEPAPPLELGSCQLQRKVEGHELPLEVGLELACGLVEDG